MVFVWSYLTDGDPAYTLVQVAVNDLIMLVLFAPIVGLLVGVSGLAVPFKVLLTAVAVFIVVPLVAGVSVADGSSPRQGAKWFEKSFLPRFQPVAVTALLATLVLIFAFQADNILGHPLHVALIAVPILIQVYFNSSLTYGLMWAAEGAAQRRGPGGIDRGEQLLRVGGRHGHRPVRPRLGGGVGDGRRRAGRSAGDAVGVCGLQPNTRMVPAAGTSVTSAVGHAVLRRGGQGDDKQENTDRSLVV